MRVQVLASGESGEDVLVKSRTGNENGNEVTAVGKHYLSVVLLYVFNVFVSTFLFLQYLDTVGHQEEHPACKNGVMRLSVWNKVQIVWLWSS